MFFINNKSCPLNVYCLSKDNLANGFCKYINVRGKNKGNICGRKLNTKKEYCYEHTYNINKCKNVKNKCKKTNEEIKTNNKIDEISCKYICYYNDKVNSFKNILIYDKFTNNSSLDFIEPVLNRKLYICYYNEDTLFKNILLKIQKKRNKNKNKKKNKKIKLQLAKLNKLININEEILKIKEINKKVYKWADDNLKTDYYKDRIYNIIEEEMFNINNNINMELKENIYSSIQSKLENSWFMTSKEDEDDIHDFKLIYKQTWDCYNIDDLPSTSFKFII
jgi:hypothetical protein